MVLRNDMGENVLESIGQGFGDELVYDADAKFFHNFVFTCLFMAVGSFFITSLVFLQYKSA